MDIVFKSGEFYEAAGNSWTPIVGFVGVIVGAFLKWGFDLRTEDRKERKRINELTSFLKITIKHLIENIKIQEKNYDECLSYFKERKFKSREFHSSVSLKTDQLFKTINYVELLKIFQTIGDYDQYLDFLSNVDVLNSVIEKYKILQKKYNESYSEYDRNLSIQLTQINKFIFNPDVSTRIIFNSNSTDLWNYIKYCKSQWDEHAKKNGFDPYDFSEIFIEPIMKNKLPWLIDSQLKMEILGVFTPYRTIIIKYTKLRLESKKTIVALQNDLEKVKNNFSFNLNKLLGF